MEADPDHEPPWEAEDGHGIVSEWVSRPKAPGERVLATDRDRHRFYDVAETLKIAIHDKWGVAGGKRPGESPRAYAARAVAADFDRLRAWCADEWSYVGVIVTLLDGEGKRTDFFSSVWGVESDAGEYLTEVAEELAEEVLADLPTKVEQAQAKLAKLLVEGRGK